MEMSSQPHVPAALHPVIHWKGGSVGPKPVWSWWKRKWSRPSIKDGRFLTSWATIGFPKRTLIYKIT